MAKVGKKSMAAIIERKIMRWRFAARLSGAQRHHGTLQRAHARFRSRNEIASSASINNGENEMKINRRS
jgi:hypothetical protein